MHIRVGNLWFRGWRAKWKGFNVVSQEPMWTEERELAHKFEEKKEAVEELKEIQKTANHAMIF